MSRKKVMGVSVLTVLFFGLIAACDKNLDEFQTQYPETPAQTALPESALEDFISRRSPDQRRRAMHARTSLTMTFSSNLPLTIIKFPLYDNGQVLGVTPEDNPVPISLMAGEEWVVYATEILPMQVLELVGDLNLHAVPSLYLSRATLGPMELATLSNAGSLTSLSLGKDWTTLDGIEGLSQLEGLQLDPGLQPQGSLITDADLARLSNLASLKYLNLIAARNITDAGMIHLAPIASLEDVWLNRTPVGNSGITSLLSGAPNLVSLHMEQLDVDDTVASLLVGRPMVQLDFDETMISDAGAASLAAIPTLRFLDLKHNRGSDLSNSTALALTNTLVNLRTFTTSSPAIDDTGLVNIGTLTELEHLYLGGVQLTDATLPDIGTLTKLRELILSGTLVTNTGMSNLAGLSELRELYLQNTALSDAGLTSLYGLSNLFYLDARGTAVSAAGAAAIEAAIPGLYVEM